MKSGVQIGDIVVLFDNKNWLAPKNLVTELIRNTTVPDGCTGYIDIDGTHRIIMSLSRFRKATEREEFLYHIHGPITVGEEE